MSWYVIVLIVVGGLAAWLAIGLLIAVPLGRMANRRDKQVPLRRTERGDHVALLAVGVLGAVALALATRGQVVTWDGVLTVGVPA